jgi:hypothetical protein
MGEHPDKEGQRWRIEHRGQGKAGTDYDKRMHGHCDGM